MNKLRPELFGLNYSQVRIALNEFKEVIDCVAGGNFGYVVVTGESTGQHKLPKVFIRQWSFFTWMNNDYVKLPYKGTHNVHYKVEEFLGEYLLLRVPNSELVFLAKLGQLLIDFISPPIPGPILAKYLKEKKA